MEKPCALMEIKNQKPNHIVSAWRKEDEVCLGQKAVNKKAMK